MPGKTRKLRFTMDRSFGSTQVRAGALVEVPEFWAVRCIAEGSAFEEQSSETQAAEPEAPAEEPRRIQGGGRGRRQR